MTSMPWCYSRVIRMVVWVKVGGEGGTGMEGGCQPCTHSQERAALNLMLGWFNCGSRVGFQAHLAAW